MKTNPILDEVWRAKEEIAREAGNDIHRMCENARKWAIENPMTAPVIRSPEHLRELLEAKDS